MELPIINIEKLHEMIAEGRTLLVDYWAPWCGYCRRINPAVEELAEKYAGRIEFVKINMDDDDALWDDEKVELIPTLRLYREGTETGSIVAPGSKDEIISFIEDKMPSAKETDDGKVYDMLIIGGGPAGYTAALYASRSGLDTLVIEKLSAGGQMALTHEIDNYPGFSHGIDGFELGAKMQDQAARFGAATISADVLRVDLKSEPKTVYTANGKLLGRTVVIATGANPRELGAEHEKELVGKGIAYCAACDGMRFKGKTVAVVGGGNSAAADALLLSRIAEKVIIIHRRDTLRATKVYHDPLMNAANVEFRWNSVVDELLYDEKLNGVKLKNVQTGEHTDLNVDGLFVSIGRKPASELVREQLDLDENGYIIAGESTQTNIPGVYAAGDVRTKNLRQVVTAVSDGAVAAHMALEHLS